MKILYVVFTLAITGCTNTEDKTIEVCTKDHLVIYTYPMYNNITKTTHIQTGVRRVCDKHETIKNPDYQGPP